jgi:4-amino-4-deoxy-L-arabinose transferase-like glycosyltransferase
MFKAGANHKESADSKALGMNPGECRLLEGAKPGPAGVRSRTFFLMVATALAIRLIVMAFMYPQHLVSFHDHFHFGFEAGRIARSIAQGEGFSSPLYEKTGPTAWMTPVYPYILAGFFKVFGVYTKAAALAVLSFNCLTSALTCLPIFFFARRSFGTHVAKWAGWTWAFFPYAIYFPIDRIWETWLATLLFALLFMIALKLERTDRISAWAGTGLLWGLAGLTSAVVVSVLPFLQLRISYLRHKQGRRWLVPNIVLGLALVVAVSPWFVRNWRTFHTFIPFRDNMGLVLRMGVKGATSDWQRNVDYWQPTELGPWNNPVEVQEFQRDGELKYMATKKQQALAFIKTHKRWYLWTSLRRMVFLWTGYWSLSPSYLQIEPWDPANIVFCSAFTILAFAGLRRAWKRRADAAIFYTIVLLVFPLMYYITAPEFYYRRPLDPIMVVLAVYALTPSRRLDEPPSADKVEKDRLLRACEDDQFDSELAEPV